MERMEILHKYPLSLRAYDHEFSGLPDLFREIAFQPRRVTVKSRKVRVLGLLEFNSASIIFDR